MKVKLKKYKFFIVIVLIFIMLSFVFYSIVEVSNSNSNGITIVIDAGHGARDGGSVGVNGTIEKNINLEYSLSLKEILVQAGYRVVLTRKNDEPLYSLTSSNKKVSDMNKRMEIIKKANPNLVISIHMNSFASNSAKGANCYYKIDDEQSKLCADYIQKAFSTYCNAKNVKAKEGDYFMLNCSYYTSVLVECGFLSNAEEELLLNTTEYKNKVINAIGAGVMLYFGKPFSSEV